MNAWPAKKFVAGLQPPDCAPDSVSVSQTQICASSLERLRNTARGAPLADANVAIRRDWPGWRNRAALTGSASAAPAGRLNARGCSPRVAAIAIAPAVPRLRGQDGDHERLD